MAARMKIPVLNRIRPAALGVLLAAAAGAAEPPLPAPAPAAATTPPPAIRPDGCLPTGNGFLRARIRGALNLDINWRNAEITCEGEPRPDGTALRISFAGPEHTDGRRMRLVFGVRAVPEGGSGHELPTNLTVIFEKEERLFATRGDDRCTVDTLSQERLGALGGPQRTYRVQASGFCIAPASTLDDSAHILVSRFDFAGAVVFADEAAPPSAAPAAPR
jgi:hypothetical protein